MGIFKRIYVCLRNYYRAFKKERERMALENYTNKVLKKFRKTGKIDEFAELIYGKEWKDRFVGKRFASQGSKPEIGLRRQLGLFGTGNTEPLDKRTREGYGKDFLNPRDFRQSDVVLMGGPDKLSGVSLEPDTKDIHCE